MATVASSADGQTGPDRRAWNVNPVAVTVVVAAAAWLLATAAIMVSLFILHGQTTSRIDSVRTDLTTALQETRMELTNGISMVDGRLDSVLLTQIGDVASDIGALRIAVDKLANQ